MDIQNIIDNRLRDIFGFMQIEPNVSIETDNDVQIVKIDGKDLNFLIGYKGQSLEALQTLLGQMILQETGTWTPISIDINDYKDRKIDHLEEITKKYIDKVRFFESEVAMPPMKAWERRQVHMFVSDYDDITTESEGKGKYRKVILKPVKK